jgi:hypothetical protein
MNDKNFKQPENCPEPVGKCPVFDPQFVKKINDIEHNINELKNEYKSYDQNVTNAIINLEDSINNNRGELNELRDMHREVITALKGVMGRAGLIEEVIDVQDRITSLENWKRDTRAFITGALAICSLISATLTGAVTFIIHILKS